MDQGRTILESSTLIEHLQIHHPGPARRIPAGDAGVEVRMIERIFDNYVMTPMQKIVLDQLRPEPDRDAYGVTEALLKAVPMSEALKVANSHGIGREMFAAFRRNALAAEEGVCTWL